MKFAAGDRFRDLDSREVGRVVQLVEPLVEVEGRERWKAQVIEHDERPHLVGRHTALSERSLEGRGFEKVDA